MAASLGPGLNSVRVERVSWGIRKRFTFYLSWYGVGDFGPKGIGRSKKLIIFKFTLDIHKNYSPQNFYRLVIYIGVA